jgi:hypothetical protein
LREVCIVEHEWDQADFRLTRLCEWAGFALPSFTRCDVTSGKAVVPPAKCYLALGPRAADFMGVSQPLLKSRGYIWDTSYGRVIPSVSPKFIQRGQAKSSAAFINDLQKSVRVARDGVAAQMLDYLLDPSPMAALTWARDYRTALASDPGTYLAFDIETPGKAEDEDESDVDSDAPDRTWHIDRIGFSYRGFAAISFPWAPEYFAAIRLLLGSTGPKVVWNAGFDVPRIRRAAVDINGIIHDGMVAWHILHSDLPKRLGFVATFTCPFQPAWKHLSGAKPAFYNATDADVELRSMEAIEEGLKASQLWDVYQRDVVELDPILVYMHEKGMAIDSEIRLDRAIQLADATTRVKREMEEAVPFEARRIDHVYINTPSDCTGLFRRPGTRQVPQCSGCGLEKPRKDHFKLFKKKSNPCAGQSVVLSEKAVDEYYRLSQFTPSRDQLIRYHKHLNRPLPMVFDKKTRTRKVSFGERQLKDLVGQFPQDMLYSSILEYRKLDKLAGTYIGRPAV